MVSPSTLPLCDELELVGARATSEANAVKALWWDASRHPPSGRADRLPTSAARHIHRLPPRTPGLLAILVYLDRVQLLAVRWDANARMSPNRNGDVQRKESRRACRSIALAPLHLVQAGSGLQLESRARQPSWHMWFDILAPGQQGNLSPPPVHHNIKFFWKCSTTLL